MPRTLRSPLAVSSLSALLGLALAGGADRPVVLASPALGALGSVRDVQIASDRDGRVTLALIADEGRAMSDKGPFVARAVRAWQFENGAWTALGNILNYKRPRPAANLNLALDERGTPVLAWNENYGDNDVVEFRAWQGGAWTNWQSRYIGISSPQAAKTRAVAAWNGEPTIIWGELPRNGFGSNLTRRRWNAAADTWARSDRLNTPGVYARQPSLVLDASGRGTAVWLEGGLVSAEILAWREGPGGWTRLGPPLYRRARAYMTTPRLALDAAGRPIVAWLEDLNGRDTLYVSRLDKNAWTPLGGALNVDTASSPSLALDSRGRPVVAWIEERAGVGRVHVAHWTGETWRDVGPLNLDSARDARSPAVTVTPDGATFIAWREDVAGRFAVQVRRFE
ncbi:hypothetical protein [Deinococcus yavapaiensis]|nr:hypothetical protein [Deinococcus yavapaiensis]